MPFPVVTQFPKVHVPCPSSIIRFLSCAIDKHLIWMLSPRLICCTSKPLFEMIRAQKQRKSETLSISLWHDNYTQASSLSYDTPRNPFETQPA